MSGSLLMVVQNTHPIEPLPAYRRDPETSSIRSSAPSYVSEAPTYHSTLPTSTRVNSQQVGLPPANYAPGFHHLRRLDRNGLTHLNFSVNQWSSVYSSPQSRHYHNVAARRTNLALIEEQNLIATLTNQMVFPTFNIPEQIESVGFSATTSPTTNAIPVQEHTEIVANAVIDPIPIANPTASTTPTAATLPIPHSTSASVLPLEDPDLVGHAAASVARERRLYIARETQYRRQQEEQEARALREESRRWDFLLAQMADWDDRERGWKAFSNKMQAKSEKRSARRVLFRFWK